MLLLSTCFNFTSCLSLFPERRGSSSSKVKHLPFQIEGMLFLVSFTKTHCYHIQNRKFFIIEKAGPLLVFIQHLHDIQFVTSNKHSSSDVMQCEVHDFEGCLELGSDGVLIAYNQYDVYCLLTLLLQYISQKKLFLVTCLKGLTQCRRQLFFPHCKNNI